MKFVLIYLVFFLLFCISIFFLATPCPTAGEVTGGEIDSATPSVMSNLTGMLMGGSCIADT